MPSPIISFLRSGRNPHPHSNFWQEPPKPNNKHNHGNDDKLNCARMGSTVQWSCSKLAMKQHTSWHFRHFQKKACG
eukprot:14314181-Ditylum_brightwellii.AAC.1